MNHPARFLFSAYCVLFCLGTDSRAQTTASITIDGAQKGISTKYIGVCEGGQPVSVLKDAGFNSYRFWFDMTKFEASDFNPPFGSPTRQEIKSITSETALNQKIDWSKYDAKMAETYKGTNGTFKTFFQQMKVGGIRPILAVRTRRQEQGTWVPVPPFDQKDLDEIWIFCFAWAYWFNVKNDMQVDFWECGNEPNLSQEGSVPIADYKKFVETIGDAVRYAFSTYVKTRKPVIFAGACAWPDVNYYGVCERDIPGAYDGFTYHQYNYYDDLVAGVQTMHSFMKTERPLWITEWGTFSRFDSGWTNTHVNDMPAAVTWLSFLMNSCRLGANHLDGSTYYKLTAGSIGDGLIFNGQKTKMYYGMRMAMRSFQGGKPLYEGTVSNNNLKALATKDVNGEINLFITNKSSSTTFTVTADISALNPKSATRIWRLDKNNNDNEAAGPSVQQGKVSFSVSPLSAVMIQSFANATGVNVMVPHLSKQPDAFDAISIDLHGRVSASSRRVTSRAPHLVLLGKSGRKLTLIGNE